jgi:hypothetical protein
MSGIINSAGSKSGVIGTTELDYEEGTFNVAMEGTTGDPTQNYDAQHGHYTKIGNRVFCSFRVVMASGISAGSGYLHLTGFPFTNLNTAGNRNGGSVGTFQAFTSGLSNASRLYMVEGSNDVNVGNYSGDRCSAAHLQGATGVSGSISYIVA